MTDDLAQLKHRFKVSQRTLRLLAERYRFLKGVIEETMRKAEAEIEAEEANASETEERQ